MGVVYAHPDWFLVFIWFFVEKPKENRILDKKGALMAKYTSELAEDILKHVGGKGKCQ